MRYNCANEISFWNLLREFKVKIPIIQRDYAQGRLGKEYLRNNFLLNLKQALDGKLPNEQKSLKLDFVYGEEKKGILYPLDGQQRLTTLWLLHWYIALKSGKLKDAAERLKNFTYETRMSSREFCENLCNSGYFKGFNGINIVDYVIKQTWFYSIWQQDPTIQSMLRMLEGRSNQEKNGSNIDDGIEKIFLDSQNNFESYWEKLSGENCPIVFYHLPLTNFGLSDDLYVKMNARGKQLTSFENFKADLIGYIKQYENKGDESCEWNKLLDPQNGIPIKFDTAWTDLFWRYKSTGDEHGCLSNSIDEIFFSFLNRFFWNELFIAKKSDGTNILDIGKKDDEPINNVSYKYLNDSDNASDYDLKVAYKGLDLYKYESGKIPLSFFQKLYNVLNNVFDCLKNCSIPECKWERENKGDKDKKFYFIPQYIKNQGFNVAIKNNSSEIILKVTSLNQVQRIVFFALCKYFDHGENVPDSETSLKHWMRVVWNLVSGEDQYGNPQIRNLSAMRTTIDFINMLDSHDVYNSLIKQTICGKSDFDKRCKEEINKAKQIVEGKVRPDGKTWEDVIIEAENYAFFRGSIRFLFRDENGEVNEKSWNDFDKKWKNARKFFDENGVREEYRQGALLLRSLLSKINVGGDWFGNKGLFWKNALLEDSWERGVSSFLLQDEVGLSTLYNWINDPELITTLLRDDRPFLHIFSNWRRYRVLTNKYSIRVSKDVEWHSIVVLNHKRNELLKDSKFEVDKNCIVGNSKYFYDWDVYFKFGNYSFKWDILEKKDVIYMTTPDYKKYVERIPKNMNNRYFSFEWTENVNLIENLNRLIAEYQSQNNS